MALENTYQYVRACIKFTFQVIGFRYKGFLLYFISILPYVEVEMFDQFKTNVIFRKATYNKVRVFHCKY